MVQFYSRIVLPLGGHMLLLVVPALFFFSSVQAGSSPSSPLRGIPSVNVQLHVPFVSGPDRAAQDSFVALIESKLTGGGIVVRGSESATEPTPDLVIILHIAPVKPWFNCFYDVRTVLLEEATLRDRSRHIDRQLRAATWESAWAHGSGDSLQRCIDHALREGEQQIGEFVEEYQKANQ
jgi:hypothetical protein